MVSEKRELRSWRERIATPLRRGGEEIQTETLSTNPTNPQTPDSLRVSKWTEESTNHPQTLPRQRLVRTGENTWKEAEWARGLCCFCECPVAEGDVIACKDHRAALDAEPMPWDEKP